MLLIIVEEEGVYKNNYLFNGGCWYSIYDNMYVCMHVCMVKIFYKIHSWKLIIISNFNQSDWFKMIDVLHRNFTTVQYYVITVFQTTFFTNHTIITYSTRGLWIEYD